MKNRLLFLISIFMIFAGVFGLLACRASKQTVVVTIIPNNFLQIEPLSGKAGETVSFEMPDLENNEFDGFYTDAELTNFFSKTITKLPDKDITLYAKYIPASLYKIYFNSGGGSYVFSLDAFYGDCLLGYMPNEPVREGFIFVGWTMLDKAGTLFDFDTVMPGHNLTLMAKWQRDYTKDYYKFLLGDRVCYEIVVDAGGRFELPAAPKMEHGFVFDDWYASKDSIESLSLAGDWDVESLCLDEEGAYLIYGNYYYDGLIIKDDTVIGYNGNGNNIIVPWIKDGIVIKNVADRAFMGRKLKSVVLPITLESIGEEAFKDCNSLGDIVVPPRVKFVGSGAFAGCSALKGISIPKAAQIDIIKALAGCVSLAKIDIEEGHGQYMSHDGGVYSSDGASLIKCAPALESFEVREGATTILKGAFDSSALKKLTIPSTVTSIQKGAIRRESAELTELTLPAVATSEYTHQGKQVPIFNLAAVFGAEKYGDNMGGNILHNSLYVPSSLHTVTLNAISAELSYSFYGCFYIKKINLPSAGLSYVGAGAFYMCYSLEELEIPSSVTYISGGSIADAAFYYCQNLKRITLPTLSGGFLSYIFGARDYTDSFTQAGQFVPFTFNLEEVVLTDERIAEVPNGAFFGLKALKSVRLSGTIRSIGVESFFDCHLLQTIEGLKNVEELKVNNQTDKYSGAFAHCYNLENLEDLVPTKGIIGRDAFSRAGSFGGTFGMKVGLGVTEIADLAFVDCTRLSKIELAKSITAIGVAAFYNCAALKSITLPSGLSHIGRGALEKCTSLEKLEMPLINNTSITLGGITSWVFSLPTLFGAGGITSNLYEADGTQASFVPQSLKTVIFSTSYSSSELYYSFYNCQYIESISINGAANAIGKNAFFGCSALKDFNISAGIQSVDLGAFSYCKNLTSITVSSENKYFKAVDGVLYSSDQTALVCYPSGKVGDTFLVPESVSHISDLAFAGNDNIKAVTLPSGLTSVGAAIFQNCTALRSVTSKGQSIDRDALEDGLLLNNQKTVLYSYFGTAAEVALPSTVEIISPYAFCNLTYVNKIYIGAKLTQIGRFAFCNMSAEVIFDQNIAIERIGSQAFSGYQAKSIDLPSSVRYIEEAAFEESSLEGIQIPSGVLSIGDYAFFGSSQLSTLTVPSDSQLYSIGTAAFALCDLKEFTIPKNLLQIDDYAFAYNKIEIFDSVNTNLASIGEFAFYCNSLQQVRISENIAQISTGAFAFNAPLYILSIAEGVQTIGDYAFCGDTRVFGSSRPLSMLTVIQIPKSVTKIGSMAFYGAGHYVVPAGETGVYWYFEVEVNLTFLGDYNEVSIGEDAFGMVQLEGFFDFLG